jgi:hypothetical protein
MFSAGLFTPAADGGQRHVSTPHAGRLQDLPLSQMAPRLPPNPDAKEETTCRTRQQRDGWEDKAKDVSELVPVTPLTAQSRTGVPPFPFPIPKPCRNPVPVWLGHRLPTQPPALCLPSHCLMRTPCTRDRRHTSTGAPPVQCRSGSGHPSPLRTVALLLRLRALPEPRRISHWSELWHGG